MTAQGRKVLLIGGTAEDTWIRPLRAAVSQLGTLDVVRKPATFDQMRRSHYDLVIIDEAQLVESYEFISQVLRFTPGVRVIVVSETPDWRRARRAFQAGASDFVQVSASSNSDDLLRALREI